MVGVDLVTTCCWCSGVERGGVGGGEYSRSRGGASMWRHGVWRNMYGSKRKRQRM